MHANAVKQERLVLDTSLFVAHPISETIRCPASLTLYILLRALLRLSWSINFSMIKGLLFAIFCISQWCWASSNTDGG
jgi:hypothetical protein